MTVAPIRDTPEQYLAALERRVLDHGLFSHPLVLAFQRRDVDWEEARIFGLLYYPHILRTRLYQAAALSVTPDETLQMALAEILADEYGRGDPDETHPAVYRRFLAALGYGPADWAEPRVLPELQVYIDTHYALCTGDFVRAAAVAGLAMEWPIPPLYRTLVTGLSRFEALDRSALELFWGHMEIDIVHGSLMERALLPHLESASARERVEEGIFASLRARCRLLDGLWHAMRRPREAR